MNDVILSPIPWETIKQVIGQIVATAIKEQHSANLEEQMLSPAETCALFNPKISKTTLTAWTKKGQLIEHRFGGRVYITNTAKF
jgi:hypothetical protein